MEKTEVLIVGGGPAGIATAASLKRRGVTSIVLEKGSTVAPAWHNRYERLHLHTNRGASGLPGRPMPSTYPRYPSRDQVAGYMVSYATDEGIDVRLNTEVTAVEGSSGDWRVTTAQGEVFQAPALVVATGLSHHPSIPEVPGMDDFTGEIIHTADYLNADPYAGSRVLVVGFGNSAGEIALDLGENGVATDISVRSPSVVVPRNILGIPILTISRFLSVLPPRLADILSKPLLWVLVGDVSKVGIPAADWGPLEQIAKKGKIPLLDVGTMAALKKGLIEARPGVERFEGDQVVFTDGASERYDAVIFGTGYRPGASDLLGQRSGLLDDKGRPLASGKPTSVDGLYFCGFHEPPTGRLREIGIEVECLGDLIAG